MKRIMGIALAGAGVTSAVVMLQQRGYIPTVSVDAKVQVNPNGRHERTSEGKVEGESTLA